MSTPEERLELSQQRLKALADIAEYVNQSIAQAEAAGDFTSPWYVRFKAHRERLSVYLTLAMAVESVPWIASVYVITTGKIIAGQNHFQITKDLSLSHPSGPQRVAAPDPFDDVPDARLTPADLAWYLHVLDLAELGSLPYKADIVAKVAQQGEKK